MFCVILVIREKKKLENSTPQWELIALLIGVIVSLIELLKFSVQKILSQKNGSGNKQHSSWGISKFPYGCKWSEKDIMKITEKVNNMEEIIKHVDPSTGAPMIYGNKSMMKDIERLLVLFTDINSHLQKISEANARILEIMDRINNGGGSTNSRKKK